MLVLRCLLGAAFGYLLVSAFGGAAIHLLRRFCRERIDTASARLAALHAKKAGTPSMGGLLIFGCWFVTIAICGDLRQTNVLAAAATAAAFSVLGACDDFIKARGRRGLRARTKLAGQFAISLAAAAAIHFTAETADGCSLWSIPLACLFITAMSNAVNVTDGLDGLAAGCGALTALTLAVAALLPPATDVRERRARLGEVNETGWLGQAVRLRRWTVGQPGRLSYESWASPVENIRLNLRPSDAPAFPHRGIDAAQRMHAGSNSSGRVSAPATAVKLSLMHTYSDAAQREQLALLSTALAGTLAGFLRFNRSPARIFMGDAGALPLGGLLGLVAVMLRCEWWLLVVGGVFVAELASVVLQVAWFRRTGRRLFRCAPLHHHYEFLGWQECAIVRRFWAAAIGCALLGLLLLVLAPVGADGKIGTPLECGDSSPLSFTAEPSFRDDRYILRAGDSET